MLFYFIFLQTPTTRYVLIGIVAGTCMFFLLGSLIIYFIIAYRKKQRINQIENKRLQRQFSEQLLQSQLEVAEQTRHYISEELHDNIGALASLIKMNIGLIESSIEATKKQLIITESKELIKHLITDVKQLSISLDTNRIANTTITEAIEKEVKRLQKLDAFSTSISILGEEINIPDDKRIILFRICQELLHNILKHAKPKNVTVSLQFTQNQLTIIITDDGIGFDIDTTMQQRNSSGLINLYNRAKLIGGSLYLKSNVQLGTHCTIQIPILPANK